MVSLKTGLHRRLHTDTYYGFANSIIINAYNKGGTYNQQRQNVIAALNSLKGMLLAIDAVSPY